VNLPKAKRYKAAVISGLVTPAIEALGGTYSWKESGGEWLARVERDGRPPIFAFWHGRVLAATLYFRDRGIIVMTSENFDGEWIARVIQRFGYGTARGSTSRGGARALAQLRRDLEHGHSVAFTVDGPRGPSRVAQPGAAWLASATGNPIVPFHIEASSYWTAKSWDRHQIPKPGSVVGIAIGEPLAVPPKADAATIEMARLALERALGELERRARALVTS
jgi:lysophospholipid acyltransferase (LPLAT)-like uncharacterized protein